MVKTVSLLIIALALSACFGASSGFGLGFGRVMPSEICKLYIDDQVASLDIPSKECFDRIDALLEYEPQEGRKDVPLYCQCIEGSAQG